jgi:hypothetical protein
MPSPVITTRLLVTTNTYSFVYLQIANILTATSIARQNTPMKKAAIHWVVLRPCQLNLVQKPKFKKPKAMIRPWY